MFRTTRTFSSDACEMLSEPVQDLAPATAPKPSSDRKKAIRPVDGYELLELAKSQQADGGFNLTDALIAATKLDKSRVENAVSALGGDKVIAQRIVATLIALRAFEHEFAARKDEWRMMADKAQRWLVKQNVPKPSGFVDLNAWAENVFK